MAKKFIWIFPYYLMEKPKGIFWPTQKFRICIQCTGAQSCPLFLFLHVARPHAPLSSVASHRATSLHERREDEACGARGRHPALRNGLGSTDKASWDLCYPASLLWLSSPPPGRQLACRGKNVSQSYNWLKLPEKCVCVCMCARTQDYVFC